MIIKNDNNDTLEFINSDRYLSSPQVELPLRHNICAVATQGSALNEKYYVTEYKLQTSLDRENWVTYQENGTEKVIR